MRIAFMHRQLAGGGTEADLRRLATELTARGHEVHVFCARVDAELAGVTIHRVPVLRAGRAARTLSFALLAPKAVARDRFDVVVGFGRTVAQDVARIGGGTHRSYLATMRRRGRTTRGLGPYHQIVLWIERRQFAARGHRLVVAVAERVRREVIDDYGVRPDAVRVVYNGVDTVRFRPDGREQRGAVFRREVGCGPDAGLCVGIGSGFERKGFDLLLRLWREQAPRGMHLALVGDDERLAIHRRRAQAPDLAGRVTVTGPRSDVDAVLAAADVLCAPSRQEAFGNVVLEACAAGVPVVTSSRVGAAELLEPPLLDLVVADPEVLPGLRRAPRRRALVGAPRGRDRARARRGGAWLRSRCARAGCTPGPPTRRWLAACWDEPSTRTGCSGIRLATCSSCSVA
jgi:UDP-glucose:(heptosyl)LPS alpha-1,3-glucosyltransferase